MLRGKGVWIWKLREAEGGDVGRIVARARAAGLSHVLLKIADGRDAYNGDVGPLVSALRAAGIDTWAWAYCYGNDAAGEARFAARRYREQPYSGFVIDAEAEYKGHAARARAYMAALRDELPDATVALSSYYLPALHPEFPWAEFIRGCDLVMPQVYWAHRGPTLALTQSLAQLAAYGKPIIPTGVTDPDYCFAPGELREFLALVRARRIPVANIWEWHYTTAEHWRIIGDAEIGEEATGVSRIAAPLRIGADGFGLRYNVTLHGRSIYRSEDKPGHNVFKGWTTWVGNGHRGVGDGLDCFGPAGTPVFAMHDGVQTRWDNDTEKLEVVYVEGGGVITVYAHIDAAREGTGMAIRRGDLIGRMRSDLNDPHLHLEVWIDGSAVAAASAKLLAAKLIKLAEPLAPPKPFRVEVLGTYLAPEDAYEKDGETWVRLRPVAEVAEWDLFWRPELNKVFAKHRAGGDP